MPIDVREVLNSLRQLRGIQGEVVKLVGVLDNLGPLIDSLQNASTLLQSIEQAKEVLEKNIEFLKKEEISLAPRVEVERSKLRSLGEQTAKLSTERDTIQAEINGLESKLADILSRYRK